MKEFTILNITKSRINHEILEILLDVKDSYIKKRVFIHFVGRKAYFQMFDYPLDHSKGGKRPKEFDETDKRFWYILQPYLPFFLTCDKDQINRTFPMDNNFQTIATLARLL